MSKLIFIRHAQASYGAEDYDQLSAKGYQQATLLGDHLAKEGVFIDHVYVGPLKRQNQTLAKIRASYQAAGQNLPVEVQMQELEEHRGPEILKSSMEKIKSEDEIIKTWDEERIAKPELYTKNGMMIFERAMLMWATGQFTHHQPDHYLDWPSFRRQVKVGVDKVLERHQEERSKTIALVTSGGTISATIGYLLGMSEEKDIIGLNGVVQNASLTEFLYTKDRITMLRFNDVSHLPNTMRTFV